MEQDYVEKRIIFLMITGSRAYGTHRPDSDYDKSGVMIPGKEYFYGLNRFDQYQGYEGEDKTIYNIKKAIKLIADNNPNMLDLLYAPERCILRNHELWQTVMDNKDLFLSKRCRYTFSGYAMAQLERIKTHRNFLLNPPKKPPERCEIGLPETPLFPTSQLKAVCMAALEFIIEEEKDDFLAELDAIYGDYVIPLLSRYIIPEERSLAMEWLQMGIKAQAKAFESVGTQYIKDEYVDMAGKEVKYYNALKNWKRFLQWKKGRNQTRSELEKKFGFDSKHALHLVRLVRMGKEALLTGTVNVDRTNIDAEELIAIRDGSKTYEEIEEYARKEDEALTDIYKKSKLQKTPSMERISKLCTELIEKAFTQFNFI